MKQYVEYRATLGPENYILLPVREDWIERENFHFFFIELMEGHACSFYRIRPLKYVGSFVSKPDY